MGVDFSNGRQSDSKCKDAKMRAFWLESKAKQEEI